MEDLTIFIKLNASAAQMAGPIAFVERSLRQETDFNWQGERREYYYPTTAEKDTQALRGLLESQGVEDLPGCRMVFLVYRTVYPDTEADGGEVQPEIFIKKLYVGRVVRIEREETLYKLFYAVRAAVTSPLVIDNFMAFSNLRLNRDFEKGSYISIENSPSLRKQLSYATDVPQNAAPRTVDGGYYPPRENEAPSEFAQKNEDCQRLYHLFPPSGKGEYQRDRDRIVNSKAFRRMVDKAQIFTASKGDHYRTRMTHTLCVAQIAREIASRLGMNVPLTEAIALGHDLGHTPFGHQGERTLDSMAKKKTGGTVGFKHNFQSLNVASVLEEEYIECSGLDLSVQVLEGMWKHTKIRRGPGEPLICALADFLPGDIDPETVSRLFHPEDSFSATVEGQIVFIADEIAQRSHDLDDALSAGLLDVDGLLEALSLKKLEALRRSIEALRADMETARARHRIFISTGELLASRISAEVISYFTNDVVKRFTDALREDSPEREEMDRSRAYFAEHRRADRLLLRFSEEGQALNDYLETIVNKQVINSAEVAAFDDKAQRIVSTLFNLYYNNPRLLHEGTLQRIYIKMRKYTDNVIHFQEADIGLVNDEWARIKAPKHAARLRDLREEFPQADLSAYRDKDVVLFQRTLPEGSAEYRQVEEYLEACAGEYQEKKRILVRAICDFISGMTDTYATNEYRKLMC